MSPSTIAKERGTTDAAGALLRPQALVDAVYDALLQRLLSLDIQPDEKISVDDLARKLGVSQTPIREALTRLESQGLVNKVHLVGFRASSQLTPEEFDHVYEARMQLEPFVAGKAAATISFETLDRLQQLLDELLKERSDEPVLLARSAQVDSEFHRTLAAEGGNLVIARILNALQMQVQFTLLRRRGVPIDVRPATSEHRKILAALRRRDARLATQLMRDHLAASRKRYWPATEHNKRRRTGTT
jgi:DNA-binding GntR family transcriptional regulator